MDDSATVDQHIQELQGEILAWVDTVWHDAHVAYQQPGWKLAHDGQPNMVESLRRLRNRYDAGMLGMMATAMYFNPTQWRQQGLVPLDTRWQQVFIANILNACIVEYPVADLHTRIEARLRLMLQNPYENTEIPPRLGINSAPDYYLPPTVEDCLVLLMGLPPSSKNVAFIECLLVGDLDDTTIKLPPQYDDSSKTSVYRLHPRLPLLFQELLVYLFAHDRLTYETFQRCVVHLPGVLEHLDRQSVPVLILCDKEAYRQRVHDYRDRLIEEIAQNMTEDNFRVLLHSNILPSGAQYLLKAAEYHVKFKAGKLSLNGTGWYGMANETIENAIVWLARATGIAPASEAERTALVARLREFPQATREALLPVTGARRLMLEALDWEAALPLLDLMAGMSGVEDFRNSPDPQVGVVDVVAVRAVLAEAGEERAQQVFKLFREARTGMSNTIMLIEATAGWNRAQVGKKFKQHTQIAIKAYGLLPLERGEEEVLERYLALRESAREGRKFGSQRRATHAAAVEVALANLAQIAGYADVSRLEWAMESKIVQEVAPSGKAWTAGEYAIQLTVNGTEVDLTVTRAGRALKSIPKEVRASEGYQEAKEAVTQLRSQASRLRSGLIEGLLTSGDTLTPDELARLIRLPAARALLEALILREQDGTFGVFVAEAMALRDLDGRQYPIETSVALAHPYHLFQAGTLAAWQREIVHRRMVQPVKQAFRELYVLTPAEQETRTYSNRFAGHLVDGRVAGRLFTTRGWRTAGQHYSDAYAYKTFPTLRAVFALMMTGHYLTEPGSTVTTDRVYFEPYPRPPRTWSQPDEWLPLEQVPPLIFSEVMRDADLIVSVGQREGEVQLSNEAYEQRGNLVKALLDDLGLPGVTIDGHFAYVRGKLARYRVHLGSAVIHIEPGNYLCIVPQRWGQTHERLFLPFADQNDTKTSEVISKILLLAADDKIKDESILRQIKRQVQ